MVWLRIINVKMNFIFLRTILLIIIIYSWWLDLTLESLAGEHTFFTNDNISFGIILFIIREVFFFAGFFWRFFHYALSPNLELGNIWPPVGCNSFNPFTIPLLNTIILLSRGVTVTLSHHLLINNEEADTPLLWTIFLAIYFLSLQVYEYLTISFTMCDRRFGSIFFIATGFHGLHVLIGTAGLIFSFYQLYFINFTRIKHLSYEFIIWYWHFVDVIWLFLFCFVYWWGQ